MTRATRIGALGAMLLAASAGRVLAQNLFEVQVFPDETLDPGETSVEFHNVLMPSGTRLADRMLDPSSHLHLDRKSTRLNSSHSDRSRMPSSA